jgi:hypothetical protein
MKPDPETGKPRLFVFNTCVNLLDELSTYRWQELSANQEGKRNQREDPVKLNDHACDALRYLVMGLPDAPIKARDVYEKFAYNSPEGALFRDLERFKNPSQNKDPFGD